MTKNPVVGRLRTRAALAAGTATLATAGLTAGLIVADPRVLHRVAGDLVALLP